MGGDHLVEALLRKAVEEDKGEDIARPRRRLYLSLIAEVEPLHGARELIVDLKDRGHAVVLASSEGEPRSTITSDLLDARDSPTAGRPPRTRGDQAGAGSRQGRVEKAGGGDAVMIGDSTWDCEAAGRAGLETVAVLTGGFSEAELKEAGAVAVYRSIDELRKSLDETPLCPTS